MTAFYPSAGTAAPGKPQGAGTAAVPGGGTGLVGFNFPGVQPPPTMGAQQSPTAQPQTQQAGGYSFKPTAPNQVAPFQAPNVGALGSIAGIRSIGTYNDIYGSAPSALQGYAPYKDYQVLGNVAQQYGQQAGTTLNDPRVQASLATQQGALAQTSQQQLGQAALSNLSTGNTQGQNAQGNAIGYLRGQANGTGPSAGTQQLQQGVQQAQAAQASMAASARGNALANAGRGAQANSALVGQQGNLQAQAIQAQEQLNAQNNLANATNTAAGQYSTAAANASNAANQAQAMYGQNLAGYANNTQAQQNAAEQYYLGQQNALTQQQQLAGNMAMGIENQALGNAAQASQMGIAQNQINNQYLGAGLQAGSAIFDSSLRGWGSGNSGDNGGGSTVTVTSQNGGSY